MEPLYADKALAQDAEHRDFRDTVRRIYGGATEIMKEIVARDLFRVR